MFSKRIHFGNLWIEVEKRLIYEKTKNNCCFYLSGIVQKAVSFIDLYIQLMLSMSLAVLRLGNLTQKKFLKKIQQNYTH